MKFIYVAKARKILIASSLVTGAKFYHSLCFLADCSLGLQVMLCDGASWSTVVEEGEPVDAAGFGATTSVIGAMILGDGRSTFDGGLSNSSNSG
ncbi:hypothetical protein Tco_1359881 [Tanacetum coccineum]